MSRTAGATRTRTGLLVGCLSLGACTTMGDQQNASLEQSVPGAPSQMQALVSAQGSSAQAPAAAVASLPADAGSVASVRGHAYANGFRQDILLNGSSVRGVDNRITVIARSSQQTTLDESTPVFKPTEAAIRSELGRTFPKMLMQVVERSMSNGYGPYGLALGRSGTTHCIYAWQWIEPSDLKDTGLRGPASVRIRLCKTDTTFDALAERLNHLTIRLDPGAETVADAIVEPPADLQTRARRKRAASHRVHRPPHSVAPNNAAMAPSALAAVSTVAQPLAVDLPPQAYLGPKAARQN